MIHHDSVFDIQNRLLFDVNQVLILSKRLRYDLHQYNDLG